MDKIAKNTSLLALIFGTALFFVARFAGAEFQQLQAFGVETPALLVETSQTGSNQKHWKAKFEISPVQGSSITVQGGISAEQYENFAKGDQVTLVYLPNDTSVFVVGDKNDVSKRVNVAYWTNKLGLLLAGLGFVFLMLTILRRKAQS